MAYWFSILFFFLPARCQATPQSAYHISPVLQDGKHGPRRHVLPALVRIRAQTVGVRVHVLSHTSGTHTATQTQMQVN